MVDLPRFTEGNVVVYATDEDLRASAEAYLTKGGLAVLPEVPLEPLSVVEVSLRAPRLETPLLLRCEVVGLQPQRAFLRVLHPPPETFATFAETPAADPASLSPPSSTTASDVDEPESVELAKATLPPYLSGEVLRFASEEDFNAAGRDLYMLGAVLATCDRPPAPGERRNVKLEVASRLARTALVAILQPDAAGMAVVQLEDKGGLARVLPEILPAKVPPEVVVERQQLDDAGGSANVQGDDEGSGREKRPSVPLLLEREGRLKNPTTAEELLELSLTRSLTPAHLAEPSTHLLLRWLLTSKGTVRVDVEVQGQPVHPFIVQGGREVRSSVAMPTLGRNLVEPEASYTLVELKRPPRMTHGGTMLQLMQEVISGSVGKLSDEDLERALSVHGGRCPQLNDVGARLLDGLGFSSSHKRLAQKALTGKESVYDVTRHAAGARSAFEVLYTLEISGGLDWVLADGVARQERQRKEKERLDRLVEGAAGLWQKIKGANHFEVLGLHWSTPPRKIKLAFEEMERLYGPSGEARAEAPDVCDRIWTKVNDAYAVLSDTMRRRAHRKEAYALKWSAQIDVLLDRADIAMYRKDFQEAYDLITVCQDIQPTAAAAERIVKLKEAKAKANLRDDSLDPLDLG